jgi:predicted ATPase
MITKIDINNFKAFQDLSVDARPLTLIVGENGVGKSSISQAILLLKQSVSGPKNIEQISLNGDYVRIGNGVDALCQSADADFIKFRVEFDDGCSLEVTSKYDAEKDVLPCDVAGGDGIARLHDMNFGFLSANRTGPQLLSRYSHAEASFRAVDEKGLNALALLHAYGDDLLEETDSRLPSSDISRTIKAVFDHYLSMISKGASLDIRNLRDIDSVSSTFSFAHGRSLPLSNIRPTNVGFGLSYASSVIIACLLARKGDVLIFENPEAHLHTKGQRAIGELMMRCAAQGVQVICETHSRELFYWARKLISNGDFEGDLVTMVFVCDENGKRVANSWFPITKSFSELDKAFEQFLEYFGGPMDFISSSPATT